MGFNDECTEDNVCDTGYTCSEKGLCACFIGFGVQEHCPQYQWQSFTLCLFLLGMAIRALLLCFTACHLLYADYKGMLKRKLKATIKYTVGFLALSASLQTVHDCLIAFTAIDWIDLGTFEAIYTYVNGIVFIFWLVPPLLVATVWIDAASQVRKGTVGRLQLQRSKEGVVVATLAYFLLMLFFGAIENIREMLISRIMGLAVLMQVCSIGSVQLVKKLKHSEQSKATGKLIGRAAFKLGEAAFATVLGDSLMLSSYTRVRSTTNMFVFGLMTSTYFMVSLTRGCYDYASGCATTAEGDHSIRAPHPTLNDRLISYVQRKNLLCSINWLHFKVVPLLIDDGESSSGGGGSGCGGGSGGSGGGAGGAGDGKVRQQRVSSDSHDERTSVSRNSRTKTSTMDTAATTTIRVRAASNEKTKLKRLSEAATAATAAAASSSSVGGDGKWSAGGGHVIPDDDYDDAAKAEGGLGVAAAAQHGQPPEVCKVGRSASIATGGRIVVPLLAAVDGMPRHSSFSSARGGGQLHPDEQPIIIAAAVSLARDNVLHIHPIASDDEDVGDSRHPPVRNRENTSSISTDNGSLHTERGDNEQDNKW